MSIRHILPVIILAVLLTALPAGADEARSTESPAEEIACVDAGTADGGYVTVRYLGESDAARAEVTNPEGRMTPYLLAPGEDAALSLYGGTGLYRVNIFEKTDSGQYALVFSDSFEKESEEAPGPWLVSNAFVRFTEDSKCVQAARSIYDEVNGETKPFVEGVYNYVMSNIAYNEKLAELVPLSYIPDPDAVMDERVGICLDYAALMTAMLRSCGVPARMIVGNFGAYYHAWVSVCMDVPEDGVIPASAWKTFDPTLGASNPAKDVQERINRGTDYIVRYIY